MSGQFPWHRVNLLVEYEHVGDNVLLNSALPSLEHIVLKCVNDTFPGLAGSPVNLLNQGMNDLLLCVYSVTKLFDDR